MVHACGGSAVLETEMKRRDITMIKKMESITMLLMEKTESRMKKEITLSRKTLKMISLSEKLFTALRTWGGVT